MILHDFLDAFKTDSMMVTLIDGTDNTEIISFKASGFKSLEDDLESREIKSWFVINNSTLKVVLAPVTTEP